eukprot:1038597-Amphidinium_carterae.1
MRAIAAHSKCLARVVPAFLVLQIASIISKRARQDRVRGLQAGAGGWKCYRKRLYRFKFSALGPSSFQYAAGSARWNAAGHAEAHGHEQRRQSLDAMYCDALSSTYGWWLRTKTCNGSKAFMADLVLQTCLTAPDKYRVTHEEASDGQRHGKGHGVLASQLNAMKLGNGLEDLAMSCPRWLQKGLLSWH